MHRGVGVGPQARGGELKKRFRVLEFLGKGSYGSVYRVQRIKDGAIYAVKEMDVRSMGHEEKQDVLNEVRLLASIRHPNVVSYYEAFMDGTRLCIVMEYAPGGDLSTTIKQYRARRRPMPEDLVWKIFIQIARGLQALHGMKIIHRDIKPGNILVTANDVVKIADLGIAKFIKHSMARTQIGTPVYMAPEVWCKNPYSFSSDAWSLGCMLYEMGSHNIPFNGRSMMELKQKILRGTYPPMPSTTNREVVTMVKSCLAMRPDARPSMSKIIASDPVKKRLHLIPTESSRPESASCSMINTIKLQRYQQMKDVKLPPAMYSMEIDDVHGEDAVAERQRKPHYPMPRPASRASSRVPSRDAARQRAPAPQAQAKLPPIGRRPSQFNHPLPPHVANPRLNRPPPPGNLPRVPSYKVKPSPRAQAARHNRVPSAQRNRRQSPYVPPPYPIPRGGNVNYGREREGQRAVYAAARHAPSRQYNPAPWNYGIGSVLQGGRKVGVPGNRGPSPAARLVHAREERRAYPAMGGHRRLW